MLHHKWSLVNKYLQPFIVLVCCVLLVRLNVLQMLNVPVTPDEAGYRLAESYLDIMQNRFASSNNHILHALFRKFFIENFADNLIFLRLDSLVAQLVFLLFSYKTAVFVFENKWIQLFVFISLNIVSPLIFEFWGLSMGYALALSFLMISVYYLLRYLAAGRYLFLILSLSGAILSVYSNFSFINYFIALVGAIFLHRMMFYRSLINFKSMVSEAAITISSGIVLSALIITPLVNVYGNEEFQFLGSTGFVADTITSLVRDGILAAGVDKSLISVLVNASVGITWLAGIYWTVLLVIAFKHGGRVEISVRWGVVLFLLYVIPVISVVLQFRLYHINYLIDRTALFFIPLFLIHLIYCIHYASRKVPLVSRVLFGAILGLLIYNFVINYAPNKTRLWWQSADDMAVLTRMDHDEPDKQKQINVWVSWQHKPAFKYDIKHYFKGRFVLLKGKSGGRDTAYDYYFVPSTETDRVPFNYTRVDGYVGGEFVLFRKKLPNIQ
jgi:hypothetical protein